MNELITQIEAAGYHVASMTNIADYTNWEVRLAKHDPVIGWSSQLVYGATLVEALTNALALIPVPVAETPAAESTQPTE